VRQVGRLPSTIL